MQAPCINIYATLLPGITNVTDRARYYSFYTWFVWAFDQLRGVSYKEDFRRLIRRADCLFCLIAERHCSITDGDDRRHSISCVGRNKLSPEIAEIAAGEILSLSEFAASDDDAPKRYFKNKLGGLGQYYFGTLSALELLGGATRTGVKYTVERGAPLAEAFDAVVKRKLFFSTLEDDLVDAKTLDKLAGFCPCNLPSSDLELEYLLDLFFDRRAEFGIKGIARRSSLALILDLARLYADAGWTEFTVADVLACCYSGAIPDDIGWKVAKSLAVQRARWAVYQRNELLSVATQGVFNYALDCLARSGQSFQSSSAFAAWMITQREVKKALKRWKSREFLGALEEESSHLPTISNWEQEDHEIQLARRIVYPNPDEPLVERLLSSIRLLLALVARDDATDDAYGNVLLPEGYLLDYPINLRSLRSKANGSWADTTIEEWMIDLVTHWGIDTHISVALRKLRRESLDTFRVRPTERGLTVDVDRIPVPVNTQPRLGTTLQILRDLGLILRDEDGSLVGLSDLGQKVLDDCHGT